MPDFDKIDDASAFVNETPKENKPIIIKAIGVGGGGNNAVNHMFRSGLKDVSFVNINTDRQCLDNSPVPVKLVIGDGLGAGNKPEVAEAYAKDAIEDINRLFDDDTRMVFITAGMGGGTGTGAAPVVAQVAKERGLLTIGIVTIPFLFEGSVKIKKAIAGADEMSKYVDALLVINNERLNEIYGDLDFLNAFGKADDTLSIAARSISEIITSNGLINLDFNDCDFTLRNGGAAIISTGYGEGEQRVSKAIRDALNSPLLKNRDILGSKKLLFNIFFDPKAEETFLMSETSELNEFIGSINNEVDVVWGVGFDETLGNKIKITILAAGFNVTLREEEADIMKGTRGGGFVFDNPGVKISGPRKPETPVTVAPAPIENDRDKELEARMAEEYGQKKAQEMTGNKDRASSIILGPNQLDDEKVCEVLEQYPTYKRDRKIVDLIRSAAAESAQQTPSAGSSMGSPTGNAIFSY
ncbi:MAG: cell division protein FtsZ [Muribaculaceae bacterium]|nr:cell division protein FtsZ [Muribaculaceae bacterium]